MAGPRAGSTGEAFLHWSDSAWMPLGQHSFWAGEDCHVSAPACLHRRTADRLSASEGSASFSCEKSVASNVELASKFLVL